MKNKVLLPIIILLISFSITANAASNDTIKDEINDISLEEASEAECYRIISHIINNIAYNNKEYSRKEDLLQDFNFYFTPDCYSNMYNYLANNCDIHGIVSNITIDFTYPDNSSTEDSVIMANAKIWNEDKSYNTAYLFEFHINSSGDIYGYNIWVY